MNSEVRAPLQSLPRAALGLGSGRLPLPPCPVVPLAPLDHGATNPPPALCGGRLGEPQPSSAPRPTRFAQPPCLPLPGALSFHSAEGEAEAQGGRDTSPGLHSRSRSGGHVVTVTPCCAAGSGARSAGCEPWLSSSSGPGRALCLSGPQAFHLSSGLREN